MKLSAILSVLAFWTVGQAALVATDLDTLDAVSKDRALDAIIKDPVVKAPIEKASSATITLPDGRRRLAFYENGVFIGSITEGAPQSGDNFVYADASEKTISEKALFAPASFQVDAMIDAVDLATGTTRRLPGLSTIVKLLRKYGGLIKKLGKRFWNFLLCLGTKALTCSDEIVECASKGSPPWECFEGIFCAGVAFKKCL